MYCQLATEVDIMNRSEKAALFAKLHVKGNPLVLYNAWDAGSAKAILEAGGKAIATSSWSVAAAHGYQDGEAIPLGFLQQIVTRIAATIDAPVSADFEGGYSEDESGLAENIARLLDSQIVGINFEDRRVNGEGLYPIDRQAKRIAAIRSAARKKGVDLFINARSNVFFGTGDPTALMADAIARATAYAAAGASGFFVPGLVDDTLIGRLCESTELPVNVMVMEGVPSATRLGSLGVARISYGPIPYLRAMTSLGEQARSAL
jgi:2-methylisocitrate lyase-like PEP mutase family enzyme